MIITLLFLLSIFHCVLKNIFLFVSKRRFILINTLNEMKIVWIRQIVNQWPGKKTFGVYRFLPIFFVLGAALEFSMINWRVGEVNFYNTFKKRQAHDLVDEKIKKYSAA